MSGYDGTHTKESGMNEREGLLDFPGADELTAAGRVEPPSAQALARALAGIEAAVAAEGVGPRTIVTTPLRRLSGQRRVLVGLFTAAAVAAGVVTYANTGTGSATHARPSTGPQTEARANTASVFLDDISTVAAARPITTGKYWKTRLTIGDEYISRSMNFYVVSKGRAYTKGRAPDWAFGPKDLDWKGLDQLTTDPAQLLRLLQAPPRPQAISPFDQASSLLGDAPASPKLRAAIFRAMAGLKGVELLGSVKDSTGRPGTAVEFQEPRSVERVTVDPKTSAILEYSFTWTTGPSKGKVTLRTFLSTGFTDTLG